MDVSAQIFEDFGVVMAAIITFSAILSTLRLILLQLLQCDHFLCRTRFGCW